MTEITKYNNAFVETFGVAESALDDNFDKEHIAEWDSVHQLSVCTILEDTFDIMFEPEDMMGLTSYLAGKNILHKYGIEI